MVIIYGLLGDPEMKFLVVNRNATESTSAALNFVPAMKNAQVVARTVIILFVKVFLFWILSGESWLIYIWYEPYRGLWKSFIWPSNTILLINFESEVNIPLLVDFAGEVEAINFSFGEKTEVEASCSTVYQGEQLIIGGWNERNQVRVLSAYYNYDKTYLTESQAVCEI